MKTRSQHSACLAFECIEARQQDKKTFPDYESAAKSLPTAILQNGLAQASGFLLAKKQTHLLDDLASILGYPDGQAFHQAVIRSELRHYQRLTRDSLEAAAWLRRYLQALPETADSDATSAECSPS